MAYNLPMLKNKNIKQNSQAILMNNMMNKYSGIVGGSVHRPSIQARKSTKLFSGASLNNGASYGDSADVH